jgi:hypothetical protein
VVVCAPFSLSPCPLAYPVLVTPTLVPTINNRTSCTARFQPAISSPPLHIVPHPPHPMFDARCAYVTSPWAGPRTLAAARLALALWMTATSIVELAHNDAAANRACVPLPTPPTWG